MGTPAYQKKIKVATASTGPWSDLPSTGGGLNQGGELLDDTDLATNAGYRSRLYGLHDWSVSAPCNYAGADVGLTMVRNAWLNRTALFVQYLPDGQVANGFQGECVVENFNLSGEVGGQETVEISLQAKGALSAAS